MMNVNQQLYITLNRGSSLCSDDRQLDNTIYALEHLRVAAGQPQNEITLELDDCADAVCSEMGCNCPSPQAAVNGILDIISSVKSVEKLELIRIQIQEECVCVMECPVRELVLHGCRGKLLVRGVETLTLRFHLGDGLLDNFYNVPNTIRKLHYTPVICHYTTSTCVLTEEDVKALPALEELVVKADFFTGIEFLSALPMLKRLSLSLQYMSPCDIEYVRLLVPRLEYFEIDNQHFNRHAQMQYAVDIDTVRASFENLHSV